jgi:DNA repair protein RadC
MITRQNLENVLSFVTKDGEAISKRLFDKYGSTERIFAMDAEELINGGENPDTVVFLKLALSLSKRRITDSFKFKVPHTTEEIEDYLFALFFGEQEEKIYAITIDENGRLTRCQLLGEGDVGQAQLLTRKLVTLCEREGARGIILAHNHPSALAIPSEDDIIATRQLRDLLDSINVKLCLHYIYSGHSKAIVPMD